MQGFHNRQNTQNVCFVYGFHNPTRYYYDITIDITMAHFVLLSVIATAMVVNISAQHGSQSQHLFTMIKKAVKIDIL